MTTNKFTHAELAAAHERGDWPLLWQHTVPLVKLTLGRMKRGNAVRDGDADDDLMQQGMLTAGEAIRAWQPMECALSTYVCNAVRWQTHKFLALKHNGGIGSHQQQPTVLSLLDERPHAEADMNSGEANGEDHGGSGGTFEEALTYEGVMMEGGQHDGNGYVPEGFRDPSEEADVGAEAKVRAVLQHLSERDQHMFCSIYGIGGGRPQTVTEYAAAQGIPLRTLERRFAETKLLLAVQLRNFSN